MNWLTLFFHFNLIHIISLSEVDENFQIPVWTKLRDYFYRSNDELSTFLESDEESGCTCREAFPKWIICFGSEECTRFPRNIVINVNTMKIRNTNIHEIKKGDLNKTTHLKNFEIEANYNLERIESGSFINMINLKNLSISFNSKLVSLEIGVFEGLINLKELFLIKNGFMKLIDITRALAPNYLPRIIKLKLNENNFQEVRSNDFISMYNSSLKELGLVLCQIEYMDPDCLKPLTNLTALRLGENTLNTTVVTDLINRSTELNIPLQKLNLYSMGLKKNPPSDVMRAVAKSNITTLNLSRNQFELLKNDSFPRMPNIIQLDLREILAVNITLNTFAGMRNLKILLLSKNKLSTVPYGVLLPQLHYLDLSSNSNLFTPSYFTLDKNKFENMTDLWGLNLSYNNIHVLHSYSFTGLTNLKVLGLKDSSIYYIADETFLPLSNLIFLDLESNPFPKTNEFKKDIFFGLDRLQVLLLGHCSIETLAPDVFIYLKALQHLSLNENQIKTLPPEIFVPLKNLIRINLSENLLSPWTKRLFSENAKVEELFLSQNKITNLTDAMVSDFKDLKSLDLSRNSFICNCVLYKTIHRNTRSNNRLLDLLNEDMTFCVYPEKYSNNTIAEYYNTIFNQNKCASTENPVVSIGVPLIIFATIITILILIIIFKYRWYLRYWIFLTRLALIRRGKVAPAMNKNNLQTYDYDAFVSYSNEDRNFVVRLVAMLENYDPFLKLCVYERDFQIGSIITENVLESVAKSRKTLLIISNSYVKSHWCRWEAQVAENHRLFFENEYGDLVNDSIVMVKLGNVSSSNMTPMLKYLIKTRVYLQWDSNKDKQQIFWNKLRKTLRPPQILNCSDTET